MNSPLEHCPACFGKPKDFCGFCGARKSSLVDRALAGLFILCVVIMFGMAVHRLTRPAESPGSVTVRLERPDNQTRPVAP